MEKIFCASIDTLYLKIDKLLVENKLAISFQSWNFLVYNSELQKCKFAFQIMRFHEIFTFVRFKTFRDHFLLFTSFGYHQLRRFFQ